MLISQGDTPVVVFFMASTADSSVGVTGITPSVSVSVNGGSFVSATNVPTEIGSGWYKILLDATETASLGPLVLEATGTGATPWREVHQVHDLLAWSDLVEGSESLQSWLRLMGAVLFGPSAGSGSNNVRFRDVSGATDRVTATLDLSGNRTAVVLDGS